MHQVKSNPPLAVAISLTEGGFIPPTADLTEKTPFAYANGFFLG